jgi:hypothetical protein
MPITREIKMTTTPGGVHREPPSFALSRSEVDVIRLINANPVPAGGNPQSIADATIRVRLSVAEAKNLIASVVLPPAAAGAAQAPINVAAQNPPLPGDEPNHIAFRLRPGQSVDWVLLSALPNLATLPVMPNGRKRRSITLSTVPHHTEAGDHADYHVEC